MVRPRRHYFFTRISWFLPLIIFFFCFFLYPIYYTFTLSFRNQTLLGSESTYVGLANFLQIFHSSEFWDALVNTLIFTFVNVWTQIILGLFLALLLNNEIRGIRFFRTLLLCPYIIPTVAACMTFKWLFNEHWGIITHFMTELGILQSGVPLFGNISTAFLGTILVAVWKFTPFATILILARLLMIRIELYEAAWIDGASSLQTLRYITLPQLKDVLLTVIFIRTIWMFRNFDLIYVLTGGGPAKVTETVPILAYRYTFLIYDLSLGSAVLVLLFVVVFIFSILFLQVSRERGTI